MENVIELVTKNLYNIFSGLTIIDIETDKVSILGFDSSLNIKETNTYEEYYEKIKKIIHPDDIKKYFESISLNNLQNMTADYVELKYSKLSSNLLYEKYIDIIKMIDNNKIMIVTLKNYENGDQIISNDNIIYSVVDFIMNTENVILNISSDDLELKNIVVYLNELISNIKKNDQIFSAYKEKVVNEISKTNKSILIVDDDNLTRNIFKKTFEKEYTIVETKNGAEAVEIIENNIIKPGDYNIVGMFLDLKMPIMDGFGVLDYMNSKGIVNRIPIIIISADDAKETKEQIYKYDIADMIEKPFNYELIKKRVNNMINMYSKSNSLNNIIKHQSSDLKLLVNNIVDSYLIDCEKQNAYLKEFYKKMLDRYATQNNIKYDEILLEAMDYYDIGLEFIPKKYINNITSINEEEKNTLKNYPNLSKKIIDIICDEKGDNFINYAKKIASMHNERYDKKGFPNSIGDDQIPYYVSLFSIAKDYSKMIYNKKVSIEDAIKIINSKSNVKYSKQYVDIFNQIVNMENKSGVL